MLTNGQASSHRLILLTELRGGRLSSRRGQQEPGWGRERHGWMRIGHGRSCYPRQPRHPVPSAGIVGRHQKRASPHITNILVAPQPPTIGP
jgi:hypothetical protein